MKSPISIRAFISMSLSVGALNMSDPARTVKPINAVSPCPAFYVKAFIHLVAPVPEQRPLTTDWAMQ